MAEYKVLEWNINLQSNKNNSIPDFVSDSIIEQNADIIIITEFVYCKNADVFLKNTFTEKGYDYTTSENSLNSNVNDVLIAWKKDKFIKENESISLCSCNISTSNIPNFIGIALKVNNKKLYVAGIRITMTEYNNHKKHPYLSKEAFYKTQAILRCNEMRMIYYTLNKLPESYDKILIAGDFNNYSRYTVREEWNMKKITCGCHGYKPYTPEGGSWDGDCQNEYALDHFITKNCTMKNVKYNRNFTQNDEKIYYKDCKYKLKDINPPYPDHAMLIGTLVID